MRTRTAGFGFGVLAGLLITMVLVSSASAHAKVTAIAWDNQGSPTKLTATATEHISSSPGTYSLKVYNSSSGEVDLGNTAINPNDTTMMSVSVSSGLPGGIYRADWTTLSADDGHTDSGTLYVGLGSDPDSDGVPNSTDNCPWWPNPSQAALPWTVPAGDSDCDGFPDTVKVGSRAAETFILSNGSRHCASTSAANDEPSPDAWPMDFNDDQRVNVLDVSTYTTSFGSNVLSPNYDKRHDLTGDGVINVLDASLFSGFIFKSCS